MIGYDFKQIPSKVNTHVLRLINDRNPSKWLLDLDEMKKSSIVLVSIAQFINAWIKISCNLSPPSLPTPTTASKSPAKKRFTRRI